MTHWRKHFDNTYLGSWDLEGHDEVTLTMSHIAKEEVHDPNNNTKKECPVLYFKGTKSGKGMVLNVTNATTIASLHGSDTDQWPGKQITLYVAKVRAFGAVHEALRVRDVSRKLNMEGIK